MLFFTIKSDMKTAKKLINIFINENICLLKVSSLRQDVLYFGTATLC